MSKGRMIVIFVLLWALAVVVAQAGQRAVNAYRTTKISTSSVIISCNDEREPVVRRVENTTLIIVTCEVK